MFPSWLHRGAAVAVLFVAAGCGRGPDREAAWSDAGVVTQVSSDSEAFISVFRPVVLRQTLAGVWGPLLEDPAARASWDRTPAGHLVGAVMGEPTPAALMEAVLASGGDEVFLVCGPGTAAQLAAAQRIKRLFEAARLRNLFTPFPGEGLFGSGDDEVADATPEDLADAAFTDVIIPLPPAMQDALESFVGDAAIPPMLVGFKLPPENRVLPDLLLAWVDGLPEAIPRDQITTREGGSFTRVRLPLVSVVPHEAARRARDLLAANIGDPYTATELIRELLSKTTLLQFGDARGYFLVSVGMDDPLAAFTTDFDESLASTDDLDRLRPHLGPGVAGVFFADPLIVSLAASPPPVGEYLDAAMESALEFAPADRLRSLRTLADPLRRQAAELFHPRIAAISGVVAAGDDGWRADLFGGSLAPRLAVENAVPVLGADGEVALLWTEHWEADYGVQLARFAAGVAEFSDRWLDALGPLFLDGASRERYGRIFGLLSTAGAPFLGEAGPLLGEAFDRNVGLVLGLDGLMPPPPFTPPAASKASLPRVAVAAGLRDRAALGHLGEALLAPAHGASALWPPPFGEQSGAGATTYVYPIPLAGPDLGLAVTVQKDRWMMGSSASFVADMAAIPRPPRREATVQSIRWRTAPTAGFATAWAAALEEDPALAPLTLGLLPQEPSTLRALAAILEVPRQLDYRAVWEDGVLHRTLLLAPAP